MKNLLNTVPGYFWGLEENPPSTVSLQKNMVDDTAPPPTRCLAAPIPNIIFWVLKFFFLEFNGRYNGCKSLADARSWYVQFYVQCNAIVQTTEIKKGKKPDE